MICLAAVVLLLALGVLRGIDLMSRRAALIATGGRRAANTSLILAEYLRQAFATTDTLLRQLALRSRQIGGPEASDELWKPSLDATAAGLSGVGSLSVTDANGIIRHSTIAALVGQSRRNDYIFERMSSSDSSDLVLDAPIRTLRPPFHMVIPLGRRLTTPDGRFAGLLAATFEPDKLRQVFRAVEAGPGGMVWVFHPAGYMLFREPSIDNRIGEEISDNALFAATVSGADIGVLNAPVERSGPLYISAYQRLAEPPLIVAVSLNQAAILADWRREVLVSAALLVVLVLVTIAVLLVLFRALDARARAELAATQAERLKALGQFTGGIAHDFNNLLSVIIGNLADINPAPESPAAEAVGEIESTAWRAAELTQRLLAFARKQPLQPKDVDLNDLVRAIEPMLNRLIGEDIALHLKLASEPCVAHVDAVQAETALINLCVNARDAMPRGGVLAIEVAGTVLDQAYARENPEVMPGGYAQVSISDTGTGIAAEHLDRVFEPFFTTKEVGRGTGLGLSMVYGFVKQSGGHVKIYSEPGQGTSVKLYFPRLDAHAASEAPHALDAAAPRGRGEMILVVEDEAGLRRLAGRILSALGYRVLIAASGPAALDIARNEAAIDLLFTDVVLAGGISGRELAETMIATRPRLKVLYASGYSQDIMMERGEIVPGLHFLAKPYAREALAEAVRAVLDDRKPSTTAETRSSPS